MAKDGSGQYKMVTTTINSYIENHQGRYVIYVKMGVYHEYITIVLAATFGKDFIAMSIAFENKAGPKAQQVVVLLVEGDH